MIQSRERTNNYTLCSELLSFWKGRGENSKEERRFSQEALGPFHQKFKQEKANTGEIIRLGAIM